MREMWRKGIVFATTVSIVCSQNVTSNVLAADENSIEIQQADNAVSVEYLTLQPGGGGERIL